jgi:hypothetical protein
MPALPKYVFALAVLFCFPSMALAKGLYVAEVSNVRIILTDEPCELKVVSNLPLKATWTQDGKVFTGCWGVMGQIVMGYFVEDRSIAAIPVQVFQKLQEV